MKKDLVSDIVVYLLELFHIKVKDNVRDLLIQIFKYVLEGVNATIIDFWILYLFRDICNFSLMISNTLSFSISVIYNYIASKKFVFEVDKNKDSKKTFSIFVIFSIIGLGINNVLVYIFTNTFKIYYLISKVIATIVVMIFNFITRKKFME